MNQQLKERLIREAGFHFRPSIENTVPGIDWNCGSWGYDRCVDRLIELVVRECADIAKHNVMNISTYADAEFVEQQIKQQFGVEQ